MNALALPPAAPAVSQTSAATSAQTAIPYRTSTPISTSSIATALAITTLALCILIACVAYARRRGWMAGVTMGRRVVVGQRIEVNASQRLSMATTAHVLTYRGVEYLVVESGRGCSAAVSQLGASRAETGEAS